MHRNSGRQRGKGSDVPFAILVAGLDECCSPSLALSRIGNSSDKTSISEGHNQNAPSKVDVSLNRHVPIIDPRALLRLAEWAKNHLATQGGKSCKTSEVFPPAPNASTEDASTGVVGTDQTYGSAESPDSTWANANNSCGLQRNGGAP